MNVIKINKSYIDNYKITIALLVNNTLVIDMEETTSYLQYKCQYTNEDINNMLLSRIHLTVSQFYDIIKAGLFSEDEYIKLSCVPGLSEGLRLTLIWTIPNSIAMDLPIRFDLEIVPLVQDDIQRMNRVIKGLHDKNVELNKLIVALQVKMAQDNVAHDKKFVDLTAKLNEMSKTIAEIEAAKEAVNNVVVLKKL